MSTTAKPIFGSGKIKRIPVQDIGLNDVAAIPYILTLTEPLRTVMRLASKELETLPARLGYSKRYTINNVTASAHDFMYGKSVEHSIANAITGFRHSLESGDERLIHSLLHPDTQEPVRTPASAAQIAPGVPQSLEIPENYAMALTSYQGLDHLAEPYLAAFIAALKDPDEATRQFWPTLAQYSSPHNLIVLEKIQERQAVKARTIFGSIWNEEGMEAWYSQGRLYALDMTIFDVLTAPPSNEHNRYTHATYTVLRHDNETKALEPIAIFVSGKNADGRPRIYTRAKATPGAWMYALQAAKVSLLVYGIWLRHVYLWHIVPSTMQMTLSNSLSTDHPIYKMMAPQSQYTIPFNQVMLLLWPIVAPPTFLTRAIDFLTLINEFAKGRNFFDDDPKNALERQGLRQDDFSRSAPWDQYACVKDLLELWDATEKYVDACVDATYADDAGVAADQELQGWVTASSAVDQGNIRGLEPLKSRADLQRLLLSILHRVAGHGGANIVAPTVLVHLFGSNYPICLQRNDIPEPSDNLDVKTFLTYLPNTETIGIMATFYFSFAFTKPYEPFVPSNGVEADLFFPSGLKDARNRALVDYRKALIEYVNARAILPDQVSQWPLNVET